MKDIKIKVSIDGYDLDLALKDNGEITGTTVPKIEMGEDKVLDKTIITRRSKLEEYKTSDTVLPKKTRKKKPLKLDEVELGAFEFAKAITPKPKRKRGRPKGKPRWPRKNKLLTIDPSKIIVK